MRTMLTTFTNYITGKTAPLLQRVAQEYRDARAFILHDRSIEAAVTRAVIVAMLVVVIGSIVLDALADTTASADTGAYIIL